MDDKVDELYQRHFQETMASLALYKGENNPKNEPRCYSSALLILKYLERISDHACYVGDSITCIVTGSSSQRLQP